MANNKNNTNIENTTPVESPVDLLHLGQILALILISCLRYDPIIRLWRFYKDGRWHKDYDGIEASKIVEAELRDLRKKLLKSNSQTGKQEEITKFFDPLFSPDKVKQVLRALAVNTRVDFTVTAKDFDQDPMFLNCLNGTVNLLDGTLLTHSYVHLLSRQTAVTYDKNAGCPEWCKFINNVMGGDEDKIAYIQRALGYSVTGLTKEHCFFLLHGKGGNGKSTLLETIRYVLGDYVGNLANESLLLSVRTIRSDIVRLQGQRVVTTSELKEQTRPLDEALIKALTAGDMQTVRESGKNEIDFTPQLKLFVATNHLPTIKGIDDGIWRRVRLISFDKSFSAKECDKDLLEKLKSEASGVLNWLIEGCQQWHEVGLNEPEVIRRAISLFRSDSNPVQLFLEDRCEARAGAKIQLKEMHKKYIDWCDDNCFEAGSVIAFGKRMVALGYTKGKSGDTRYWKGIRLKTNTVQGAPVNGTAKDIVPQVNVAVAPSEGTNQPIIMAKDKVSFSQGDIGELDNDPSVINRSNNDEVVCNNSIDEEAEDSATV